MKYKQLKIFTMKTLKNIFSILCFLLATNIAFTSCSSKEEVEEISDYATQVQGVYTGKLYVDNTVIEDPYYITIARISSTVVTVAAEFYDDGMENYNVEYSNGQYYLRSDTSSGITITINGKNITINFLNNAGTMTSFYGKKD